MSYVWGVDVATTHLAFAFAETGSEWVWAQPLDLTSKLRDGPRLAHILDTVGAYAVDAMGDFPPAAIWVEQPFGSFVHPTLMFVTGVVTAALFRATGAPTWMISPSQWKRATVGKGNARKDAVEAWVRAAGYEPASEHEADATAIAYAGRALYEAATYAG